MPGFAMRQWNKISGKNWRTRRAEKRWLEELKNRDSIKIHVKQEHDWFSFPDYLYDITQLEIFRQADVVNLHWIAEFVDYQRFFKNIQKPVVWTLHDMFPFTGGCHYTEGCTLYMSGCNICPQLPEGENRRTGAYFKMKMRALHGFQGKMAVTAPSAWLTQTSKQSPILGRFAHHTFPYGLSAKNFRYKNQIASRLELGLPVDGCVLLFLSFNVKEKRKGFAYFAEAVELLPNPGDFHLVTVGKHATQTFAAQCTTIDYVTDEDTLATIYAAADALVIPSLQDNLPLTAQEALMCGCPLIAFALGGFTDLIEHKKNGLLVPQVSAQALADTIEEFQQISASFNRKEISENTQQKYDIAKYAEAYMSLFKEILK